MHGLAIDAGDSGRACTQGERPVVSVLLPVRDGGAWLAEAVASVLMQSWRALELLVVDDHSSDGAVDALSRHDPRLRILASPARGAAQTAWQILVASSPAALAENRGDLWDSGKVASAASSQIAYQGRALAARESCHWKVRVWDEHGELVASLDAGRAPDVPVFIQQRFRDRGRDPESWRRPRE